METSQVIIAHVIPVPALTAVRSTLLQSSLETLKALGLFEPWRVLVSSTYRERIMGCVAPEWIAVDVAMAHYEACDRLCLRDAELLDIGRSTAARLQGTFLDALSRTAHKAGVTPWAALPYFGRMHARILRGGSAQFMRAGPKDILIDWRGVPLFRFRYFRTAYCGFVVAALKMLSARSPQASIVQLDERNEYVMIRCAWV